MDIEFLLEYLNMKAGYIWIVVGIVLLIGEIFTPGFVLACFGIGCLASALVSFLGMSFKIQIISFSVVSLAVFFGVRPLFFKYVYRSGDNLKTNVDALAGKKGFVSEEIDPKINRGRVIVDGEDWKALSIDETMIEKGKKIEVIKVEGTKLFVKRIEA